MAKSYEESAGGRGLTRRNTRASTDTKYPELGQLLPNKGSEHLLSNSKEADSTYHQPVQTTSTKKGMQPLTAPGSVHKVVVNVTGFCKAQGSRRMVLSAIVLFLVVYLIQICLLYTSPSPRDATLSRMPSSA